jgi:hypothetical protein
MTIDKLAMDNMTLGQITNKIYCIQKSYILNDYRQKDDKHNDGSHIE